MGGFGWIFVLLDAGIFMGFTSDDLKDLSIKFYI
jgi:hypothetical protein